VKKCEFWGVSGFRHGGAAVWPDSHRAGDGMEKREDWASKRREMRLFVKNEKSDKNKYIYSPPLCFFSHPLLFLCAPPRFWPETDFFDRSGLGFMPLRFAKRTSWLYCLYPCCFLLFVLFICLSFRSIYLCIISILYACLDNIKNTKICNVFYVIYFLNIIKMPKNILCLLFCLSLLQY
jgi:hypothetical protein